MNSAIPENASISSNLRSISARRMPMMAPCRYTFSRPVRSGWNPAATSMSAPIRPRTRQWPSVGRRIRVSSFSAVDLPAPLAPMMPRASPGPTENETSRRAQNSALPSGSREPRPSHRATVSGTRSRRLSWRSPLRNFLETPMNSTAGGVTSDVLRKTEFRGMEDHPREHAEHHRGARRRRQRRNVRRDPPNQNRAIRVENRGHRVERQQHPELPADALDRIHDRRREHPDGDRDLEQILHVAVEEVSHGEQEA